MKKFPLLYASLMVLGCAAQPQLATPPATLPAPSPGAAAWIQLGEGGTAEVRAVVEKRGASCPHLALAGGGELALARRAEADDKFPMSCAAKLPTGARLVDLPAVIPTPTRILVLGDTGCRLKDQAIQNCNNPVDWPFPNVAAAAARLKPDLVIHLGDYQYRESPCPAGNAGCAGTPYGDNWPAWKADFFAPAAPLLKAAPWIFVRGNHEECVRSGPGYLRLLAPGPWPRACAEHQGIYRVPIGGVVLMVMDNAHASDTDVDAMQTPVYHSELAEAMKPSAVPVWLVMHRPVWAAVTITMNIPAGGNAQIAAVAQKTMIAKPIALMLAGHIHSFQAINFSHDGKAGTPPPQIVAGNGGDSLYDVPANLKGTAFEGHAGVSVLDGLSVGGFGFLLMTQNPAGWTIDLYDAAGVAEGQCLFTLASDRLDCPRLPGAK
jgi:hypothetical protein